MIQIRNLSKKYGNFYALKDINLDLPSKGLIGISGESGSGKSTLLNAIALTDSKYEGEIIINQKNILKYNKDQIDNYHLNIGYIFQSPYLFNFCSVKENIEYMSMIKGKKNDIDEVLKKVGLIKYKDKKVNALSGGQRQRVCIASSIISNPSILLCDEPTGALDSVNGLKVMEILKEISKDILVIVVSHDLELLNKYSDSIIYMKEGKIINHTLKETEISRIKFKKKRIFSYLKFVFLFSFKNIINHKKRTTLTAFMISFGLIGIILSMIIKDGFSSFFETSLGAYESNKYTYCYNVNEDDSLFTSIDTFEIDFKDYERGYFYKYDFKDNGDKYQNSIIINGNESYLKMNHLGYLIRSSYNFKNDEIGLAVSSSYLNYLLNIFSCDSLDGLNNYLKKNDIKFDFHYIDNNVKLNFELRLRRIIESKSDYTYFIHSFPLFLRSYFKDYISYEFEDESKIVILPYIKCDEKDKNDLLVNENKKKYQYLFNNELYDEKYTFVFKSNYYRMDINLAKKMSSLINSEYILSTLKGIDMMGKFSSEILFEGNNLILNGEEISFIPNSYNYKSSYDISISSGLMNLLNMDYINIRENDRVCTLKVINVIPNSELVIYQNSEWSYKLVKEVLGYDEYECLGVAISFNKNDDNSIELLKSNYVNFEFVCPLKEVGKEIDDMIDKVKIVLLILSSFCIVSSLLLMAIIVFINTIEQSKLIAVLRVNGVSRFDVIIIYIIESLLLGLISYLISYYSSFVFTFEFNLVFNQILKDSLNIITLKKDTLINVFQLILIMSLISGIFPSLIASRKRPLEVLKS